MNRFRFLVFSGWLTAAVLGSLGCDPGDPGTGGSGGIGGSGGSGGSACDPAACPPASNECVDVVCGTDGACSETPKADGTLAATQNAGDCNTNVCQAGAVVKQNDDADVKDDGNECTLDECSGGVASHSAVAIDSPCGQGGTSYCDGNGVCSECTSASQCPGTDTECQTRTCDMGVCGVSNVVQGTPVASQTVGNCLANVCDGNGGIESVADDLDVEDDGNECTDNACSNGMTVTTPTALNTPCGAGGAYYCDSSGACVGCTDASQCGTPGNACLVATCVAGVCGTANQADGALCNDNDACTQTDTCQAGACAGGNAVICSALDQCHDAGTCNAATGLCDNPAKADGASCNDSDACTQTDTCQAGACTGGNAVTCSALDQCHDAGTCNAATGLCDNPAKADGASCNDSDACTQTDTCQSGACMGANPVTCALWEICDAGSCVNEPITYIKASNTGSGDYFGYSVALSGDGNTLAVGAINEDSNATGVGGNQADNSVADAGAVYVYTRSGGMWAYQAYIKASNTGAGDFFGRSLALSADGNTLAVSALHEDSNATGVGGDQANNSATDAGAVYVFTRSGAVWSQQAYVKASNTGTADRFGMSVALSSDGNMLAVGAVQEGSNATGVGGDQTNNLANSSGAVYVFTRSSAVWSQQEYIKASNTEFGDGFGSSVALSSDGNTLAVGAVREKSNATGAGGNQTDNSVSDAGAVYVFTRSGAVWSQQEYIKASNTGLGDFFGNAVALSSDGNTLAVGAYLEYSNATGVNGNQADNSATSAGAVYTFARTGTVWSQQAYIKASNTEAHDHFGTSITLSGDGNTLVAGADYENGKATGINGNQNNLGGQSGAAYVFTRSGAVWSQLAYVKPSNAANFFGASVALSSDANTLAVGAFGERSNATGVNGNQADNSLFNAGAVYVY